MCDVIIVMQNSIEWTNSESARTKAAIAAIGYVSDPFCGLLCSHPMKRTPEIHRGYYCRQMAVNHVIHAFCTRETNASQVVNIGAGSDALYWRLAADQEVTFARVIDVDTDHVISQKCRSIEKHETLREALAEWKTDGKSGHALRYHAIGCDATNGKRLLERLRAECDLDENSPILLVFECVLLYWSPDRTRVLFQELSRQLPHAQMVILDVFNTSDRFSQVMKDSLSARQTPLLGLADTSDNSLDIWRERVREGGFQYVLALDLNEIYEKLLEREEVARVEQLEMLDERELLTQLLHHYCLIIASNERQVFW